MSGGPTAIKGFQAQTLVALLESLELKESLSSKQLWQTVTIEPLLVDPTKKDKGKNQFHEKVDIYWEYPDGTRRAVQVKSTSGSFTTKQIRTWAQELRDWESPQTTYELHLVGGSPPSGGTSKPVQLTDGRQVQLRHFPEGPQYIEGLRNQATTLLSRFFDTLLKQPVDIRTAGRIVDALDSQYLQSSAKQEAITRDSLIAYLRGWVPLPPVGYRPIRLFLAVAPGVQNATAAVDDAISSLNRTYRNRLQVELQRFDWNDDHPSGSFQPNLVVDGQPPVHDLYIAVVSSRLAETAPRAGEASTTGLRQALEKWQNTGPGCFCLVVDSQAKNFVDLDQDDEVAAYKTVQKIRQSTEFAPFVKTYESTDSKSLPYLLQDHLSGILNRIPVATRASAAGGAGPTYEPSVPAIIPPAYI
ncbi:MAG: hypothetical protein ACK5UC_18370, partial [Planctomycetaceae bacterium]